MNDLLKKFLYFLVLVIFVLVITLPIILIRKTIHNNTYNNRAERCLKVYEDSKKLINFNNFTKTYYNEFFKAELYYQVKDYYILSSYKSYMPCGHTDDIVSYNALRDNISLGARFIHLDIFYKGSSAFDKEAVPIVANIIDNQINHLKDVPDNQQYLMLENCLNIINNLAWKKCDYPLFLYLNMEYYTSNIIDNKVFQLILKILRNRFVNKKYSFQRIPPGFRGLGDLPINEAMNKVIILSNRIPIDPLLNELVNGIVSPNNNGVINYELTKKDLEYGDIKSKFIKKESALNLTKYNLTLVNRISEYDEENIYVPKSNTENWNTDNCFELGFNFIALNLQNYPGKDDYTKKYLEHFKNGSFKLKPKNIIGYPRPNRVPFKQHNALSFASIHNSILGGFAEWNI